MNSLSRSYLFGITLAGIVGMSPFASAQLVNPGFDDGPLGSYTWVVSPVFHGGFWGDEASQIVGSVGSIHPCSDPFMLQMSQTGGNLTETWQAVDVTGNPPDFVELNAWANSTTNSTFGLVVWCFSDLHGWPDYTFYAAVDCPLDTTPLTWQQFNLGPLAIPTDTEWILVTIYFRNSSMGGHDGYVDDVDLIFHDVVSTHATTWGAVKSLFQTEGMK